MNVEAPRIVKRGVYALALVAAAVPLMGYWAPLVAVAAWYGIVAGHGSYFPRDPQGNDYLNVDNEGTKWITRMIRSPMNNRTRLIGMSVTGLVMTIPVAAVCFAPGSSIALTYGFVGVLKGFVYFYLSKNTEQAEWLWGAFSVGSLAAIGVL